MCAAHAHVGRPASSPGCSDAATPLGVDLIDENGDSVLRGGGRARPLSDVYLPTTTYTDRHTVTLGGKRAIMVYTGLAHAPTAARFIVPTNAPCSALTRCRSGACPAASRRRHALSGTRKDIEALRQYLEDISAGVAADVAAGRGLAETQTRVTLEAYRGWDRYDTNLQGHVAQVYAGLKGPVGPKRRRIWHHDCIGGDMTQPRDPGQSHQVDLHVDDSDLEKGAIEGAPDGQGNPNGTGLDDQGWPNDEVATAQDRIGANEDKTSG